MALTRDQIKDKSLYELFLLEMEMHPDRSLTEIDNILTNDLKDLIYLSPAERFVDRS